jgi:hypothetical protein
MPRLFTIYEAEAMLPEIERSLRSAIESKKSAYRMDEQLNALLVRINLQGGIRMDLNRASELKSGKEESMERLKSALSEIEESGCVVKDLDIGLIDFPTMLDDTEVYLCWKLGEAEIRFWHGTDEGFAGRKSIDSDFIGRHRGGKKH